MTEAVVRPQMEEFRWGSMRTYLQSKGFEAYFAARSAKTESGLDQIARALRAKRLLPSGPRGRHAPRLNAGEMANFLIAACMAASPGEAVQTVKDFGSLLPLHKFKKTQLALFKQMGVTTPEINLHNCLACIFRSGLNDAQKYIEEITFERLPPHPDIRSRFKVRIRGGEEWTNTFETTKKAIAESHFTALLHHFDARKALVLETVTLGRDFLHGLFMESNASP